MLKICEIYPAIQGESSYVGLPCLIVRLAGCNLDCSWCDTSRARNGTNAEEISVEQVVGSCRESGLNMVLITGGEPLLQEETKDLLERLIDAGFRVLLETNGSLPIEGIPQEVTIILDMKCPGSGMQDEMLMENLDMLRPHDEVKFVIADRRDFDYALNIAKRYHLVERSKPLFSPAFDRLNASQLAQWMLESRLFIRLNLQIHKYIWGSDAGKK